MRTVTVPRRFNGPPHSANGGWFAGALAETLPHSRSSAITVRLQHPPPLDTPVAVTETPTGADASHRGRTIATASYAEIEPTPVPPVPADEAARATERFEGNHRHPFPHCFVCGTQRRPDDGLRIFPGPTSDRERVATTWTPYDVSTPIVWAALDCPGAWSCDLSEQTMLLGTITARVHRRPETSERYVVVAAERGTEGRKSFTAATLYDSQGNVSATAEHVWITVDATTSYQG